MTFRHLNIFLQVCNVSNMTKAADLLHMSQPSVSQAVAELEAHYQVKLFERLGKKLYLTAAGHKLNTYANHIVNLNSQTEEAMRQFGNMLSVRLGASVTIGESFLIGLIGHLQLIYPQNRITSNISNTDSLEKMLLNDDIDLALIEGSIHSDYLLCTKFMTDELIFIASPKHPLAKKSNVTIEDIGRAEFYLREEGSGTRSLIEKTMHKEQINYNICGTYNNASSIKKAVAANLGISIISRLAVQEELDDNSLVELKVPALSFKRYFSIVHHKNKYLSAELKNIINLCHTLAEEKT